MANEVHHGFLHLSFFFYFGASNSVYIDEADSSATIDDAHHLPVRARFT